MGYYPEAAQKYLQKIDGGSLEAIVTEFPVNLKMAMYAAASKPVGLAKGRWSARDGEPGCAFNEAGKAVGDKGVVSAQYAAAVFGISERLVIRFIRKWDSMFIDDDKHRANILKQVLTAVGLTTPPEKFEREKSGGVKIISDVVYKGTETKFIEALKNVDTIVDLGFDVDEAVAADDLVRQLVPA